MQRRGFSFCFLTGLYSEGGRDRGKEHRRKEITDGNGTRDWSAAQPGRGAFTGTGRDTAKSFGGRGERRVEVGIDTDNAVD